MYFDPPLEKNKTRAKSYIIQEGNDQTFDIKSLAYNS